MIVTSPVVGPTSIGRGSAVLFAETTQVNKPCGPRCTAAAGIDEANADAAVVRCSDRGVVELRLCGCYRRFIRRHGCLQLIELGLLLLDILFRNDVPIPESGESVEVFFGGYEQRRILRLFG